MGGSPTTTAVGRKIEALPPKPTVYNLIIFQRDQSPHAKRTGYIDRELFEAIQDALDETITTPPELTEIDVWIDSPGGDAHVAYKIDLELRARCSALRAVVVDYAKSAATLLLLGMDVVYMAPAAELGPLDMQIEHPHREGVVVSALDVTGPLEFLGQAAVDLAIAGGARVLGFTQLPRTEVLNAMLTFAAQGLLQPSVAKLDLHLVHQARNQLSIARHYALTMLERRRVDAKRSISRDAAERLLRELVHSYPAHATVIDRDEARKLGLPIENIETYPKWPIVRSLMRSLQNRGENVVSVVSDGDLPKTSGQADEEDEDGSAAAATDGGSGGLAVDDVVVDAHAARDAGSDQVPAGGRPAKG